MKIGPRPDAMEPVIQCVRTGVSRRQNALDPGIQCARTHWNRGFTAFQLARSTRTVTLMVLV
jgi:hypothetical protein